MNPTRPLPEIVRDLPRIKIRHAAILASAQEGVASSDDLVELSTLESDLQAFARMCIRTGPICLMQAGFVWNDELRHPALPGFAARVRLADHVDTDEGEMTISEATILVARRSGKGIALADWHARGIRIGQAFGLEPLSVDGRGPEPSEDGSATQGPSTPVGSNYSLF